MYNIYIYTHTIEITERRKNKKEKILLVMRTLRTYSLNNIPMFTQLVTCSHHVGHYIPSIYLSYIGNLYLLKKMCLAVLMACGSSRAQDRTRAAAKNAM